MTNRFLAIAVGASILAGLAPSSLAQGGNFPVVIQSITWEIARNQSGKQNGPFANPVPFNPTTDIASEFDVLIATAIINDNDWLTEAGDEAFYNVMAQWQPFPGYTAPEPGPVPGTFDGYAPQEGPGFGPGEGNLVATFPLTFQIQIPDYVGKNQARLRGRINYDVAFTVLLSVTNIREGNGQTDESATTIFTAENPLIPQPNAPAFADAGPDQTVEAGSTVLLDGSRTFDSYNVGFNPQDPNVFDKDSIQYTWEWTTGPERVEPIVRDPANAPSVAEVTLNMIGKYSFRLTADDGVSAFPTTDTVSITVVSSIPPNRAPVAKISGPTGNVVVGSLITLDGTGSLDPDGDPLWFRWSQTDELGGALTPSDVTAIFQPLSGVNTAVSTWQALKPGTYYIRLLVQDGIDLSTARFSLNVVAAGTAGLTIERQSGAPVADASNSSGGAAGTVPGACGGSLLSLAMLPLCLCLLRGRRW